MKSSVQVLGQRTAEIFLMAIMLVLASRASLAHETQALDTASKHPVHCLDPK